MATEDCFSVRSLHCDGPCHFLWLVATWLALVTWGLFLNSDWNLMFLGVDLFLSPFIPLFLLFLFFLHTSFLVSGGIVLLVIFLIFIMVCIPF